MNIVVGYKGTNIGKDLMKLAVKHAKVFDANIMVVTSMVGGNTAKGEDIAQAKENLDEAKAYFEQHEINCETHLLIRGFSAGEDLVEFAKEKNAEEIIIGVKSRSKMGKLVFGSTAQYVILKAKCPVVSVK